MNNLRLIELRINPETDCFVSAISLVENPAIESDFIAFSKDKVVESFSFNDEAKELLGAAMVPDMPIERNTKPYGRYAATFSKATIRQIAQVYAQKGLFNKTNIEHSATPADSFLFQSYITDREKGIAAPKGIDVPDGTWIVGVKVLNDSVWQKIKSGEIKGFSVEGVFQMFDTKTTVSLSKESAFETAVKEFETAVNSDPS